VHFHPLITILLAPTQYQFVCKFTGKPTQKGIKLEQKEGKRKMKREKR